MTISQPQDVRKRRALVTGAGGFIGHHLVKRLKSEGYWVRGVDIKYPVYEPSSADEFEILDLRSEGNCHRASRGVQDVYQLAADMGGIGYITSNHATITRNNSLINTHMLESARCASVERYLYTSSACVYPSFLQNKAEVVPLKETDVIPADPEPGYGWEKLFAEKLVEYYRNDYGMNVRIARFHNIYGTLGTYEGGREKAPAAMCRKVAEAPNHGKIEVWGDGKQTRSFCYIDDCVEGLLRLMTSSYDRPVNIGTDEMVTVNQLLDIVCAVAGKDLTRVYDTSKPQGVRGRNSDNSLFAKELKWVPRISLKEGISRTYPWILSELAKQGRAKPGGSSAHMLTHSTPASPIPVEVERITK